MHGRSLYGAYSPYGVLSFYQGCSASLRCPGPGNKRRSGAHPAATLDTRRACAASTRFTFDSSLQYWTCGRAGVHYSMVRACNIALHTGSALLARDSTLGDDRLTACLLQIRNQSIIGHRQMYVLRNMWLDVNFRSRKRQNYMNA